MRQIIINNHVIGVMPYVIAEIGCNHCGSLDLALQMVDAAASCGADAVKFQRRTPEKLFTPEELAKPYESPHSYGHTYGEHRAALDWFGMEAFTRLKERCELRGVDFIVTPFTEFDFEFVKLIGVHAVKVASCDLKNTKLLEKIAAWNRPVIVSTGGGGMIDMERAYNILTGRVDFAFLHCVSSYPNSDDQLNLNNIRTIQNAFPYIVVGFSSHHPGLLPNILAYALGARIFEVHFTLNRGFKGTDHGFSLEPEGLRHLCADLRRIDTMQGYLYRDIGGPYAGFVKKFGKSWYAVKDIPENVAIEHDMVHLMAPADGYQPFEDYLFMGKVSKRAIPAGKLIQAEDLL